MNRLSQQAQRRLDEVYDRLRRELAEPQPIVNSALQKTPSAQLSGILNALRGDAAEHARRGRVLENDELTYYVERLTQLHETLIEEEHKQQALPSQKVVISFDTRLIANRNYRGLIEESPGFHLAPILRELADECDQCAFLPESRELLLEDGTPIGDVITVEGEP